MAIVRKYYKGEGPDDSGGEAKVIKALAQYLPDDYIIIPNYKISKPKQKFFKSEQKISQTGEVDAIVIGGECVALIEVKNWRAP